MRVIYQMPPIDLFFGCMTMDEAAKSVKRMGVRKPVEYIHNFILSNCRLLRNEEKVKDSRWEGDISELWFFAIPTDHETKLGMIIKQSNKGTTFVISPTPLDWLQDHCGAELIYTGV